MVKTIPKTYLQWSNRCGDLYTPFPEMRDIDKTELPEPLRWLFENCWSEDLRFSCYLTQLDGVYGISLQDEWSRWTAELFGLSYEEYLTYAMAFADRIAEKFPKAKVMFSKDYYEYTDGSKDSILAVFISYDDILPYGTELSNIAEFMSKEHPIHKIYDKRKDIAS